jgi:hypothetical protein
MKAAWQLMAVFVTVTLLSSCGQQTPGDRFVRQRIPVEIQKDQPFAVEINSLSAGTHDIGIQCPTEVWTALTNNANTGSVRLKASSKPGTQIGGITSGSGGTSFIGYVPNTHYLFYVQGEPGADATAEITFSNAPEGVTSADIIVCKNPTETAP